MSLSLGHFKAQQDPSCNGEENFSFCFLAACFAGGSGGWSSSHHAQWPWGITAFCDGTIDSRHKVHSWEYFVIGMLCSKENRYFLLVFGVPIFFGHSNWRKEISDAYSLDLNEVKSKYIFCWYWRWYGWKVWELALYSVQTWGNFWSPVTLICHPLS